MVRYKFGGNTDVMGKKMEFWGNIPQILGKKPQNVWTLLKAQGKFQLGLSQAGSFLKDKQEEKDLIIKINIIINIIVLLLPQRELLLLLICPSCSYSDSSQGFLGFPWSF